jgi:flagellar basal body-associated protein FliL
MGDTESQDVKVEKKKGGTVLLVLVVAVLVLGAAATGAVLAPKFLGSAEAAPEPSGAAPPPPADTGPGETYTLAPIVIDSHGRDGDAHHVKVVLAIELADGMTDPDFKRFVPRSREAALQYLRAQAFEELTDPKRFDKVQKDLNATVLKAVGAKYVSRVLVTDFVAQ